MAEPVSNTSIVPAAVNGEYMLEIKEFNAAGAANKFMIPIPSNVDAVTASAMIRAGVLSRTTWKGKDFPTVLLAVFYADRMGLDIMAGDVYMAEEGRLSTTAGAKIRHAMSSGIIRGYEVDITNGPDIEIPWKTTNASGSYKGPNLKAKVTVYVKNWDKPMIYETSLEEWFVGRNPNWRSRPAYMLRRNALSKALEEVAPLGIESDEAPPIVEVSATPI